MRIVLCKITGWITMAVAVVGVLSGCSSSSQDSSNSTPESREATAVSASRSKEREHGETPRLPKPFLAPRDAPPAGVKKLVEYFQEGGPPVCHNEEQTSTLSLSFGVDSLPRKKDAENLSPKPQIGDALAICILGVRGEEPVSVTVDAPEEDPAPLHGHGYNSPNSFGMVMLYVFLTPKNGTGTWNFTAHSKGRTAQMNVVVGQPSNPGYRHIDTRDRRYADFLLVGLAPNEPFSLHLYEPLPSSLEAEYMTTVRGQTGADGSRVVTIDSLGAKKDCYIAKVEVEGHMLDDRYNTLSVFCPLVESE